jgi:hypothetical protein
MKALLFTTLSVFKYIWMYNEIILGLTDLLQHVFLGLDNYKLANEISEITILCYFASRKFKDVLHQFFIACLYL